MATVDHRLGPLTAGSPPPADGRPMSAAPLVGTPMKGFEIPCFDPKQPTGRRRKKKKKKRKKKKKKKKKKKEKKKRERKKRRIKII